MADATVTLGLNAAQLTTGLRSASSNVDKFAKGASSSFSRLSASLGVLGGGFTLGAIVKRGFEFNQTMQDSEIAISNVLQQLAGLNSEASKAEAAKAMQQLIDLEPEAAGSLTDLVQGFMATVSAAQGVGISVNQNIDLVGKFANALSNANLPVEQLGQEMRSILTGDIGADSSLAKILGITNEMIGKAREAGNLYEFLSEKIGKLGVAGDTAGVALSSLGSAIDKAAGALTKGLFGEAISGAKEFAQVLDDTMPFIEDIGKGLGAAAKIGRAAFEGLTDAAAVLMLTLDKSQGGSALDRARRAMQELDEMYKRRAQMRQKEEAAAKPGGGAGGSSAGGSVSSIVEKQKKDTYDIAKNIQEQAKAADSMLDPYRQFLNYLEQEKKKLDEIKAKKDADKQATQSKIESQKEAAQALQDEIRILEAKASGNEDAIKAAEREVALKQKARDIQTQLQVDAKTALDIAKQMQALEDKAQKAKDRPGGRIQGYSSERQGGAEEARGRAAQRAAESASKRAGAYSRGFGGLGDFYNDQNNPNFAKPMTPNLDKMNSSTSSPVVALLNEIKDSMARTANAVETFSAV